MLNRVVRVGILVLFQNLAGGYQVFTVEHYVGCGFVINSFYYVDVCSLYTHFGESLYHKWMLNFLHLFSMSFLSSFVDMVITLIDLHMLNHPCDPGINASWS